MKLRCLNIIKEYFSSESKKEFSEYFFTLEESLKFQKEFLEIAQSLQMTKGWYRDGEFKLRVSEDTQNNNHHNWKQFVIWNVFGEVIYDSSEDFSKVVYCRFPDAEGSLKRLKAVKDWNWRV